MHYTSYKDGCDNLRQGTNVFFNLFRAPSLVLNGRYHKMYRPDVEIPEITFCSIAVPSDAANTAGSTPPSNSRSKESCLPRLLVLTGSPASSWTVTFTFTAITPVMRQSKPTHRASFLILQGYETNQISENSSQNGYSQSVTE